MKIPSKIANPRYDEPLCSRCGLCMGNAWPEKESLQSCVFNTGWLGMHEERLFGRRRDPADPNELAFGITRSRFNARIKQPVEGAQWGGIITRIALRALETGLVDGVLTLHGTHLNPKAFLATSPFEVLEGRGNKPVLAPTLVALHTAWSKGIRKLLVIGASCHVHALRDFQSRHLYLRDTEIHIVGIPCTDNLEPANMRYVFNHISRHPESIVSLEFMQDYRVHIKHSSGPTEKIPYFCLPPAVLKPGVFSNSCMSCFDYLNSLADITVGYFGAPFSKDWKLQWLLVRTEKGEKLFDLIRNEVDISPEMGRGDAIPSVRASIPMTAAPILDPLSVEKRKPMPRLLGELMCLVQSIKGPRGIEFARYSIHIHAIRNYLFVKHRMPERLNGLVPEHIHALVKSYGLGMPDAPKPLEML
ncbi:MAG: coenzyme F420 hydrogenase [Chlorobiaceae bacterium]|nr:coenzyme F420 hydrogenase [Chlorobiaceae bacterium]